MVGVASPDSNTYLKRGEKPYAIRGFSVFVENEFCEKCKIGCEMCLKSVCFENFDIKLRKFQK